MLLRTMNAPGFGKKTDRGLMGVPAPRWDEEGEKVVIKEDKKVGADILQARTIISKNTEGKVERRWVREAEAIPPLTHCFADSRSSVRTSWKRKKTIKKKKNKGPQPARQMLLSKSSRPTDRNSHN